MATTKKEETAPKAAPKKATAADDAAQPTVPVKEVTDVEEGSFIDGDYDQSGGVTL
jgi:hypothetical protein